ncbi:hypothetical protein QJQ45_028990 [Haematococcus lacustris]|nr:hypothetical protein QJQ45_028990 [Haematococcus lacustris]
MDDDVANDDTAVESTDSIQEEFGYEYSEDTLNLLRSIPKPLWKEEQDAETSLDPVGELSEYLAHDLPLPPPVYDTMQHVGAEALAELQEAMDRKPDPQDQQDAEYRTQLARGTDPREMTWLKLRAYHRAMNQYENHVAAVEGLEAKQRLQDYQVPTDLVPAQLLQLSPEELLASSKLTSIEDHRAARTEAAAAAAAAAGEQSGVSGGWHGAGAGYTTEAAGESRSRRIADQYGISADEWRQGLAAAFPSLLQPHMPPWQQQQLEEEEEEGSGGEGPPEQQGLVQEVRVLLPYSNPPRSKPRAMEPRTIYTEAYLAEQALLRQWRQQSRQRTLAFWSGLGTVSGSYLLRWLWRKLVRKGKAAPKQSSKAAKLQ